MPSPAGVTVEVVSDNPSSVAVTPDPADQKKGSLHFGSPNADGSPSVASLVATVLLADGTVIGSFGEQFTVTAGDPAALAGGSFSIPDLTPSTPEAVAPTP